MENRNCLVVGGQVTMAIGTPELPATVGPNSNKTDRSQE
jgi:hypothetical protein